MTISKKYKINEIKINITSRIQQQHKIKTNKSKSKNKRIKIIKKI
jgi:hypothetical protein